MSYCHRQSTDCNLVRASVSKSTTIQTRQFCPPTLLICYTYFILFYFNHKYTPQEVTLLKSHKSTMDDKSKYLALTYSKLEFKTIS